MREGDTRVSLLAGRGVSVGLAPHGGSEVLFWEDFAALQAAGWTVRAFARRVHGTVPAEPVPLLLDAPFLVGSLQYAGFFVLKNPRGVLLTHGEPAVALLAPARTITRLDYPTPLPREIWRAPSLRRRFGGSLFMFPSAFLERKWRRMHPGLPSACTTVVHNSVDLSLYSPRDRDRDRPITVGFAGQWFPGKGIETLLDAWSAVSDAFPEAELRVAGGPDLWKGLRPVPGSRETARLLHRARGSRGIHLDGLLPRSAMPDFWNAVDVAVVPSLAEESFGLVALEAMACGVPVVASNSGALPEVVGGSGVIVPRGDARSLGEALTSLLGDGRRRSELARAARDRAALFSPEARAARLVMCVQSRRAES